MNIQQFLTTKKVPFEVLTHSKTFDSQHLAEAVHVPGREVAKTVLLRLNGGFRFMVAVLPATCHIDLDQLQSVLGGVHVEVASKAEITARCPDCEPGVLPPFGSHYGLETVVDRSLALEETIVFEGNARDEAIKMRYADFYNLEHPLVVSIACQGAAAAVGKA